MDLDFVGTAEDRNDVLQVQSATDFSLEMVPFLAGFDQNDLESGT
jgi:hypothetical protein